MIDLFQYKRRPTDTVDVGSIKMGSSQPVRIQSMTTTNTNDTGACVEQALRIIEAGGELVRFTTQGSREAENMKNINAGIRARGKNTPLVADVHFNANVADVAALYCEKVRINPGNYVDPARRFVKQEYTDEEYAQEIKKIEARLVPLLDICKANHTALRIGVNHGSLSDRIRNRYGDTPQGIVESCMEFLRICKANDFGNVVISVKSSNTVVMVRSVRLLVDAMDKEDMHYPLHLGVTEAGEGEDGRIKSAVGIGALLADGIGDTIRVSLTEEPEAEIPVARHLVDYIAKREGHIMVPATKAPDYNWLNPSRRTTRAVMGIGGSNLPVVITSGEGEKADYVYAGGKLPQQKREGQRYIVDFNAYDGSAGTFPIFPATALAMVGAVKAPLKFVVLQYPHPADEYIACLRQHPEVVVVCASNHVNRLAAQRALVNEMMEAGVCNPVVFAQMYALDNKEEFQLDSAADMGALMMDGVVDGIWLMNNGSIPAADIEDTAFGILQAARLRCTKTEYISCPGCGRTLYNLQQTIARIKEATKHLRGLKIGIMGCIVNGPGEMADADYGYVGAGPGKVSLYRRQVCVEKNIPEEEAVGKLLELIEKEEKL